MRHPGTGPAAAVLAVLATIVALLLGATPASAHTRLVRVTPPDGGTVAAPTQVTLTFDEPVRPESSVVVTGPDGGRVDQGKPLVAEDTASTRVAATVPGRYTVRFRVVSEDGHTVADTTTFNYRPGGATAAPTAASHAPEAGHAHGSPRAEAPSRAGNGRWAVAGVAGAVLLGGVALLAVRRRGSSA